MNIVFSIACGVFLFEWAMEDDMRYLILSIFLGILAFTI